MTAPRHFLAYATANDPLGYLMDEENFRRMARFPSGSEKINVAIAVSEVTPASDRDRRWYKMLASRLESTGRFTVLPPIFKSNIGRDFSSWLACVDAFRGMAGPDDFVMAINRSAYGPLMPDWYARYLTPFAEIPDLASCGTTINFEHGVHVQSYLWMTRWRYLEELAVDFPGRNAATREEAIHDGEIATSVRLMQKGYCITCLAWPGEVFHAGRREQPALPQKNISAFVKGTPHRHNHKGDIRRVRRDWLQRMFYALEWGF